MRTHPEDVVIEGGSSKATRFERRRANRVLGRLLASAIGSMALIAGPATRSQQTDFTRPQGHFRVHQPAEIDPDVAMTVYSEILDDMVRGYALSRNPAALRYRDWRRYNWAPYRSATHGDRFVNQYANAIAAAYGDFGENDDVRLPVGSVVAKDSFAITADGEVFFGPLFLMEKMPEGFDPPARDWRYSMILPDGSYFGITEGESSERVAFCATCHRTAGDEQDHLFFVPEDNRFRAFRPDQPSGED